MDIGLQYQPTLNDFVENGMDLIKVKDEIQLADVFKASIQ